MTDQTPTDAELHARCAHPDWEYTLTEGPRKQWDYSDEPPYGDDGEPDTTWERNVDMGRKGWERFDYTEESYWRRRKPEAARQDAPISKKRDTCCGEPSGGICIHDAGATGCECDRHAAPAVCGCGETNAPLTVHRVGAPCYMDEAAARQAINQQPACPGCGHTAHHPGTECEAGVEHGLKRWHRCLCLNLVGAETACHPKMTCQGGTLGYSDVWHIQRRSGLRGLLEHVGIDTTGRDIAVDGKAADAARPPPRSPRPSPVSRTTRPRGRSPATSPTTRSASSRPRSGTSTPRSRSNSTATEPRVRPADSSRTPGPSPRPAATARTPSTGTWPAAAAESRPERTAADAPPSLTPPVGTPSSRTPRPLHVLQAGLTRPRCRAGRHPDGHRSPARRDAVARRPQGRQQLDRLGLHPLQPPRRPPDPRPAPRTPPRH